MDWRCCYCCISWCLKSRDETRQSDISKGKDAEIERSAGARQQQQLGAVCVNPKNIITGDFWLAKLRSPITACELLVFHNLFHRRDS